MLAPRLDLGLFNQVAASHSVIAAAVGLQRDRDQRMPDIAAGKSCSWTQARGSLAGGPLWPEAKQKPAEGAWRRPGRENRRSHGQVPGRAVVGPGMQVAPGDGHAGMPEGALHQMDRRTTIEGM